MTDTVLIADDNLAHHDRLDGILAGAGSHIQQTTDGPADVVLKDCIVICW
jgi:hypothetical protein